MKLSEKQQAFTYNISLLIQYAFENGFFLTFGEAYRTIEQQQIYFDSGRSKTMNSRHLQKLAVDFNIFKDGRHLFAPGISKEQYKCDLELARPMGEFWESLNIYNVWGGDWNRNGVYDETFDDPYHFETRDK